MPVYLRRSATSVPTKIHFQNNTSSLLQLLLIVIATMLRVFLFYSQVPIWYSSLAFPVLRTVFQFASLLLLSSFLFSTSLSQFGRLLCEMGLSHLPMARSWNEPVTLDHILIPALPDSRYVPRALCTVVYRLLDELSRWFESLPRAHVTEYSFLIRRTWRL